MAGANDQIAHKVLSFAFKEIERREFEDLLARCNNDVENQDFRNYIESKLIYIGTFGLYDELRQNA